MNESKTLTKHISCECKCRFDGRKCDSGQWWNIDKCWCKCKKPHVYEKDSVGNLSACNCENGKYLASIMKDSAIVRDEFIEPYDEDVEAKSYDKTKAIPANVNEKKTTCKT